MRVRVWAAAAVAAAALMPSSGVIAQTAEGTVELPAVVVTAPSPVVKPVKKKSKGTLQAPQAPSDDVVAAPSAPSLDYVPLPGSIVATEGVFVPVTVTTQRELVTQGGARITDTLQLKPGISGTTFAPGADRPIIRGLDSYRVRIQENGIGTHDVSAISEDHAIPIDPLAADHVEVVRGPATLRYGSQAIGGVVSV
jgi:iron complex outermembrane receptor protein